MKNNKPDEVKSSEPWKWCPDTLQWLRQDSKSNRWIEDHHPLPEWFIEAQGNLSAAKFIAIWQQAETLNDVKKNLHWLSLEEIVEWYQTIDAELISRSIQPLKKLYLHQNPVLSEDEIQDLVESPIKLSVF